MQYLIENHNENYYTEIVSSLLPLCNLDIKLCRWSNVNRPYHSPSHMSLWVNAATYRSFTRVQGKSHPVGILVTMGKNEGQLYLYVKRRLKFPIMRSFVPVIGNLMILCFTCSKKIIIYSDKLAVKNRDLHLLIISD